MIFPSFNVLLSNYKGDSYSPEQIFNLIGGKVLANHKQNAKDFLNTCALRMSYAFNYSGISIPFIKDKTGSGADGKWYFYRVSDLHNYILDNFYSSLTLTGIKRNDFIGTKGVILFKVNSWFDSTGHFTLWDGKKSVHGDYFNEANSVTLWIIEKEQTV
ncbi:MAG: type VI secretion system amidase effector protein Tae4 [Saprospiraceae bacterium]